MILRDPDFEAMKDMTRLTWQLDFEAIPAAGNDDNSLPAGGAPPT